MLESLHFFYDNVSSIDMGVIHVNSSSSLFEEFFLPTRTIHEQASLSREKPYFLKVKNEPISFPMTIYLEEGIEVEQVRKIARWLFQNNYKPLVFSSNPNRILYAIIEGESHLIHNGEQGYINVNVRCDSPYAYTPEILEEDVLAKTENEINQFTVDSKNFDEGKLHRTKVNEDGSLELKRLVKWGDIPPNYTWGDLFEDFK